ncbi:MAG TPA: type II toxin-antitoxin system RelE/ParE family toxin [Alphaproteobacteria bacterium]|nr:type II toxin-antitoxin system RelE/ParE family toxin [Alphaproteobacteria bacterium]
MAEVLLRPLARVDLGDIWEFVAEDSSVRADALLRQLATTMRTLAGNPLMGRLREDLLPGLRSFAVGSYIIFYRPGERGIEVARVLHGARDIPALFG